MMIKCLDMEKKKEKNKKLKAKVNLGKNIIVSSFDSKVIDLHWYSFLWLIGSFGDWLIPLHGGITLYSSRAFTFLSVAWPFSVASLRTSKSRV